MAIPGSTGTGAGEGWSAKVTVYAKETAQGLWLCGSTSQVGQWEPEAAVELRWSPDRGMWESPTLAFDSSPVEVKLLTREEGKVVWQGGGNTQLAPLVMNEDGEATLYWDVGVDGSELIEHDEYLKPQEEALKGRYALYQTLCTRIAGEWGGWEAMTTGYDQYGLNRVTLPAGTIPPGASAPLAQDTCGIMYREWAPGAQAVSLVGDFNGWSPHADPAAVNHLGVWSVFLPDTAPDTPAVPHLSHIKTALIPHGSAHGPSPDLVQEAGGAGTPSLTFHPSCFEHRVPAWVRYATLDAASSTYCGVHWAPSTPYVWCHARPVPVQGGGGGAFTLPLQAAAAPPAAVAPPPAKVCIPAHVSHALQGEGVGAAGLEPLQCFAAGWGAGGKPCSPPVPTDIPTSGLRIYECHVGLCTEEHRVGTYAEFAKEVLPRVVAGGYNAIQLMGVMEHAYYASFGYHITSFHAVASRSGTPDDFKALVDAAHGAGVAVIMDCVHSHASSNVADGLNTFDGTDHQYFHEGGRGQHEQWDSRLFNYTHPEVLRFLLSNLRWWVGEYGVDGFRFDGVTSMMYTHHGIGVGFSGDYGEYFGPQADVEAQAYLMLANTMLGGLATSAGHLPILSIAEDVSGMPGLCRPVHQGGMGFHYRLAMAVPDMWIKHLKEVPDEQWDMGLITHTLLNRRWGEDTLAYTESHDQALVGDKTLAMWLLGAEMYTHMSKLTPSTPSVQRGMALHKMLRGITLALGGEGYLAFTGNTFGHPEWLDFPRIGNEWSFQHCRRQWSLVDDPLLRYGQLEHWDRALLFAQCQAPWLKRACPSFVSIKHESDKIIVADRGSGAEATVFVFNFHPSQSFPAYPVPVPAPGTWRVVLSSDEEDFGGQGRVVAGSEHPCTGSGAGGRPDSVLVYSPSRTMLVLRCTGGE